MGRGHRSFNNSLTHGAASLELIESLFRPASADVTAPSVKPVEPVLPPKLAELASYHRLADGSLDVLKAHPWLEKPLQTLVNHHDETQARVSKLTPVYAGVELTIKSSAAKKDIARVEVQSNGHMQVTRSPQSGALQAAVKALQAAMPTKPTNKSVAKARNGHQQQNNR